MAACKEPRARNRAAVCAVHLAARTCGAACRAAPVLPHTNRKGRGESLRREAGATGDATRMDRLRRGSDPDKQQHGRVPCQYWKEEGRPGPEVSFCAGSLLHVAWVRTR